MTRNRRTTYTLEDGGLLPQQEWEEWEWKQEEQVQEQREGLW
jgi:hypothetical protein